MYRGWSLQEMSDKFSQGISTHLDTNGTMGNVSSPNLQIQLSSDLYFAYGVGEVEFYRASPATYVNKNDVLVYAPIDTPRFEKQGLLIESAGTNYVLNSSALNWTQGNCISTLNTTETKAPDGTNTATKIRTTGVVDPIFSSNTTVYFAPAGKQYTYSVWLWIPSGHSTECVMFMYQNISGTNGTPISKVLTLTTTPTRYEFTRTMFTEDTGLTINLRIDPIHSGALGNTVYCWGAQLEEGTYMSSYIPTTTAIVTRQPDSCNVMGMYNFPNQEEVSVSVEVVLADGLLNVDNRLISAYDVNGVELGNFTIKNTKSIEVTRKRIDGVVEKINTPTGYLGLEDDVRTKVAYCFSNNSQDGIYVNSVPYPIVDSSTNTFKPFGAVSSISIGGAKRGTVGFEFNGHFKNLKIYDKALTQTEFNLI